MPRCTAGKAGFTLRRHRPDEQVRLRRAAREGTRRAAAEFLRRLHRGIRRVASSYRIPAVLTDNGTQVTDVGAGGSAVPEIRAALEAGEIVRVHACERACARADIDHRLTRPNHPWSLEDRKTLQWSVFPTNGQVERMNRTIKAATVRRYHSASHDQLRAHLADFVNSYNFANRLKTLRGLTVFAFISSMAR